MLLAIDSGNTNIVFAVLNEEGEILGQWRSSTDANRTADEFGVWLRQLISLGDIDCLAINAAIIASVVPASLFDLKTLCRKYFDCQPLVVGDKGVELGLNVLMNRPEEVGADRLVNAIAANKLYDGPLIIIDFGTATTFDVIDGDGNYCGGAIAPGVNLSLEALHQAAAKLPRVAIERTDKVIGKGTRSAMQSGMFWGYVSMIEGMVGRICKELGAGDMQVIATGGLAPLFAPSLKCIKDVIPDLVIRGLFSVYQLNVKS